jgi:hypothetical protein
VHGKVGREAVAGVGVLSMLTIFENEKETKGSQLGAISVGDCRRWSDTLFHWHVSEGGRPSVIYGAAAHRKAMARAAEGRG